MRIRYQKLKGMEVLANKEGRLLGSIRRLQIDSKKKTAIGLVFKGKLMSGEHWSRVSGVERIGEDVVFLTAMKSVREDEPKGRDAKDMFSLPVNTMDGKRLGTLDDMVVDFDSWQIVGIVMEGVGVVEVGPEAVFGEDTILLRKGAGDEIIESADEQGGFLARVFQSEPEKTPKSRKPAKKSSSKRKSR